MTWPKITLETPMEELKRIHQDIWQYVVENGEKPETPYTCNCVGCEYCGLKDQERQFSFFDHFCKDCPIDWKSLGTVDGYIQEPIGCSQRQSIYKLWLISGRSHLAELIRDVKWKFEKEE